MKTRTLIGLLYLLLLLLAPGECLAIGGDSLAGGMTLEGRQSTLWERMSLAFTLGVLVAGMVESMKDRTRRFKPFLVGALLVAAVVVLFHLTLATGIEGIDPMGSPYVGLFLIALWVGCSVSSRLEHDTVNRGRWVSAVQAGLGTAFVSFIFDSRRRGLDPYLVLLLAVAVVWVVALFARFIGLTSPWLSRMERASNEPGGRFQFGLRAMVLMVAAVAVQLGLLVAVWGSEIGMGLMAIEIGAVLSLALGFVDVKWVAATSNRSMRLGIRLFGWALIAPAFTLLLVSYGVIIYVFMQWIVPIRERW